MRFLMVLVLMIVMSATTVSAQDRNSCGPRQGAIIDQAMRSAKALTLKAATTVRDDVHFQRWFGTYTQRRAAKVRTNFKSMLRTIRSGGVTFRCKNKIDRGCQSGEFAFVHVMTTYEINLCPAFFVLPKFADLRPGQVDSEHGTRAGVIIHELSHFRSAGDTDDYCYARAVCADMAQYDPTRTVENADSYQYFAEDITYFEPQ